MDMNDGGEIPQRYKCGSIVKYKVAVIYNICGIAQKNNLDFYVKSLDSIMDQYSGLFDIYISACQNNQDDLRFLKNRYGIPIHHVHDKVTVNISFNKTVLDVQQLATHEYNWFMYLDSGISFPFQNLIGEMISYTKFKDYAMISSGTENDEGTDWWLNDRSGPAIVPIGKSVNLHAQLFSRKLLKAYGKIIPDIFGGFRTESTFTFLCAAIKKQWLHLPHMICEYNKAVDGASIGFTDGLHKTWQHDKINIIDILNDKLARKHGLGYEECNNVMMHDPSQFDENHHCVNAELKNDIKRLFFMDQSVFDYGTMKKEII